VAKDLADGFEDDLVHGSGATNCTRGFGWLPKTLYYSGDSRSKLTLAGRAPATRLRIRFLAAHPKSSTALQDEREFDLLCALARKELSAEQRERVAGWSCSAVDWDEFLRLATHHGVLPIAARNLIAQGHEFPPEIEHSLRTAYEANLRRSLWFTAELTRITRQFDLRQLKVIPYKGPVLAQSLYGDPGMRSFSDLDFLISAVDFERAKSALAEIGYRPSKQQTSAIERLSLQTGYECAFDGAAGKYLVELQWAMLPKFYGVDLEVDDLLTRAGRAVVGGCSVTCLSPEDSLLALCLHAAKHLWTRLIWLTDIAETLRTQSIDYSLVSTRASELGILRMLGVSFWLAKNVLRVELPESAAELIAVDPQVPTLGVEFAERLMSGSAYDFESTEYFRLILELRERRRDRWRYLWRLVWTPGEGDIAAIRLPGSLFPLYRIVRIGRLTRRFLLKADG
jgi:Uncharacterised nucleotidyltransferase